MNTQNETLTDIKQKWEVLKDGEWVPLVLALHPEACETCQTLEFSGFNHPECETLVPGTNLKY